MAPVVARGFAGTGSASPGPAAKKPRARRVLVRLVRIAVWLTVMAEVVSAHALDPRKAITQYVHEVWRMEDGLPQSTVTSLAQTPDGYLWIGTEGGLARFDGTRFVVFDKRTNDALRVRNVEL